MTIQAPQQLNANLRVFLGGTIEMGNSRDWQSELDAALHSSIANLTVYNPRRKDWDTSWYAMSGQLISQIDWELNALEAADVIVIWLEDESKSPISLLELGLHARSGKVIVRCTSAFYRYTNVLVTCNKYRIPIVATQREVLDHVLRIYRTRLK